MITKQYTVAAIVRYDHKRSGVCLFCFDVPAAHENPEALLRSAIGDFARTSEGQRVGKSNAGDFNWGDAANEIPPEWWEKYGVVFLRGASAGAVVEHDENFCEES